MLGSPFGSVLGGLFGYSHDAIKAGQEQQRLVFEFDHQRAKSDAWPKEAANPAVTAVYVGPKLLEAPKDSK